ncbi:hypothetical protein ABIE50_004694 [Chitinophaga sp. OAE865]
MQNFVVQNEYICSQDVYGIGNFSYREVLGWGSSQLLLLLGCMSVTRRSPILKSEKIKRFPVKVMIQAFSL